MSDIWTDYPTAKCYAYNPYPRRLVIFTGAAKFHPAARKWLPVGDSICIEGPLEGHSADATAGDLTIKPGCEAEINKALQEGPKFIAGVGSVGDGSRKDPPVVVMQR